MYTIPIGVDNFHELVTGGYLFCDKTAMIAEFFSKGEKVTLITRPRRWGKTLNMSMLQHFLSAEVNGVSTASLFDDLAIAKIEEGKYIKTHQGKYPVIMLSFKDVKADSFAGAYNAMYELIREVYDIFVYLLKSNKLSELQLEKLNAILRKKSDQQQLEASLKLLSECLHKHHGQRVYILIDEYDTPLNQAYGNTTYLDALVNFMRNLFSSSLKGNNNLERGVLTGILRVSKDSMLSGLNNLETYTMLDKAYSSHFGFSDEESQILFHRQGLSVDFNEVRRWYNGYRSGDFVVYNPWSILLCMNRGGYFDVYWVNTGNNDLIKQSLLRSNSSIKSQFEQLMQGVTLCVPINKHLSFDLLDTNEAAFWSFLLFAGYLKAEKSRLKPGSIVYECEVSIPNYEVRSLYNSFFEELFMGSCWDETKYSSFLNHLVVGDIPLIMRDLGDYLLQTASSFDTKNTKKSEGFYHGFVLAMVASLSDTHYIRSNRESGYGRYDVLLVPRGPKSLSLDVNQSIGTKSILLEFKQVRKEEELAHAAHAALEQIQAQAYRTALLAYPYVTAVVEVGIAFSGKSVLAAYSVYDLVNKQAMPVQLTSSIQDKPIDT